MGHRCRRPATGWVHHVDERRLLEALPAGASLRLDAGGGDFVFDGSRIGRLSAPQPLDDAVVASALTVSGRRIREGNIKLGMRELVDIALQALAPGTSDATSAYEAIRYLGAVLQTVRVRELPSHVRTGDAGRRLVRGAAPTYDDYVAMKFDQIRQNGATYPAAAAELLKVLNTLADEVVRIGARDRLPALQRQIDMTLHAVRHSDLQDADRVRVLDLAERLRRGHRDDVYQPEHGAT